MNILHEHHQTFMIISRSVLLRIKYTSDKTSRENQNTHFMFDNFHPKFVLFVIMWENILAPGRSQMTTWCMCFAR